MLYMKWRDVVLYMKWRDVVLYMKWRDVVLCMKWRDVVLCMKWRDVVLCMKWRDVVLCMQWRDVVHWCMVHRERVETASVSSGAKQPGEKQTALPLHHLGGYSKRAVKS